MAFIAMVMAAGVSLRFRHLDVQNRSPDETYYMYYAQRVAQKPLDGPRELVSQYNATNVDWDFPIPLRIGYYYLIALIMKVSGASPMQAGVALSTLSSIVQLVMVAIIGFRFFNKETVLVAAVLLSVSPQDLAAARRVWGDGLVGCAALILVWICAEIHVREKARGWFSALWIFGAYFMLLKESGGFFFGFCVAAVALARGRRESSIASAGWILAGGVGTAVCSFLLMAMLCGGIPAVLEVVRHNVAAMPFNDYLLYSQVGPWYSFPLGLWVMSPLAGIGCGVGFAALMLRRNALREVLGMDQRGQAIACGLAVLIVLVIATASLPKELKNLRYISFIVGPWYLMAGLGLTYLWTRTMKAIGRTGAGLATGLAICLLVYGCWGDYARYRDMYVTRAISDLDIRRVVTGVFDRGM